MEATAIAIETEAREALDGDLDLPMLPTVVAEIMATSADENYDPAHLATIIQQDQAIASHVLRVINSPIYQGTQKIVALQQAIARLGLDALREIAIAASMGSHFSCAEYKDLASEYWSAALGAALWSKEVARMARANVEITYLSGLLHNIGAPLMLQCISKLGYTQLPGDEMKAIVDRVVDCAGLRLAESWALPPAVPATIANLDSPESATGYESVVASVSLGIHIAQNAPDADFEPRSLSGCPACLYLSLYPDQLDELWSLRERVSESIGLFG